MRGEEQASGADAVVPPAPPTPATPPPPAQPPLAPPVGTDAAAAALPPGAPLPPGQHRPGQYQPTHHQPPQGFRPTSAYRPGPSYAPPGPSGAAGQPSAPGYPAPPAASAPAPAPVGYPAPGAYPAPNAYPPSAGHPAFSGNPATGYPASTAPAYPPPSKRRRSGLAVAIIAMGVVLLIGIAAIAGVIVSQNNRPEAVPTSSEDSAPVAPDPDDTEVAPEDEPSTPPSDTGGQAADVVIQDKIDEYRRARQDGSLWQRIPDNEFNQTAVSAFLYLLTDMKVAAIWGADPAEYLDEVAELERKLLAQEPLGTDIQITLSDRTFTYDGDTGEGGYTDN